VNSLLQIRRGLKVPLVTAVAALHAASEQRGALPSISRGLRRSRCPRSAVGSVMHRVAMPASSSIRLASLRDARVWGHGSGGIAALNPRLMAGNPAGCGVREAGQGVADGKVVIGSEDGSVYCFGVKAK
jgi:hypothetical protein